MRRFRACGSAAAVAVLAMPLAQTPAAFGQTPPTNGMREADLRAHAIVDAAVIVGPGERLERATILIRDGVIEAVGPDLRLPADARQWSGEGLTVYAGLIEPALYVDAEHAAGPGTHWNRQIRAEVALTAQSVPAESLRKELRSLGFTTAAVYPSSGILRGSGVVVALGDEDGHVLAYDDRAMMAAGFDRGGGYPGSLMGSIALLRQTLLDADWHAACCEVYAEHPEGNEPPARADALTALEAALRGEQQVLFDVESELDALRAARVADEFGVKAVLVGGGTEFRWLDEIVATGCPLVIPLEFPKRPEIDTVSAASNATLREMMAWEQAPTNVRRLLEAGATVALTTHRLKSRSDLYKNLVRARGEGGLDEDAALAALTTTPAAMLGLDRVLGTIEAGKAANLVVVEGSLFEKKPTIRDVWVNGRRSEISAESKLAFQHSGVLEVAGRTMPISVDTRKKSVTIGEDDGRRKAKGVVVQQDQLSFVLDGAAVGADGYVRLSGVIAGEEITGTMLLPAGDRLAFSIRGTGPLEEEAIDEEVTDASTGDDDDDASDVAASDPLSGEWLVELAIDGMDDAFPLDMDMMLAEDGAASGSVLAMGQSSQMSDVTYDAASGDLAFTVTGPAGTIAFDVTVKDGGLSGSAGGDGFEAAVSGTRRGSASMASAADEEDDVVGEPPPAELVHPLGAYGLSAAPTPTNVLFTGATVWTCGESGVLENADVLVVDGRIAKIGVGLAGSMTPEAIDAIDDLLVLDVTGKHVTPGLIDCHSHTGISGGVNEMGQTNTAEVRIGDCINPDDVNWYRQLAGGLTACNQLHGSANPIGGQNSVVKLKWGGGPSAYPIDGAIAGIKFALGENVVRSSNRYPNTRMGVETFIADAFTAAMEYRAEWGRYHALRTEDKHRTMPPRRDLEMETLVEILEGDRLVHCHSYRQDEILMLVRVAEAFGFTIGTFQHVLEGYKVAEAVAAHGAGGSTFSDWWAYKVEVMDAIPHNGALMTDVGVTMSFNSDSSELARRMNTEAAKAVRYGGLEPAEALKLVTLNPAKQLRVDDRIGSLEVGKDADLVIWSGDPLSTYSRCEQTWIDGACMFSFDLDAELAARDAAERQRLEQKILEQA
ncbi:MAG: amidohydrolase family protein, partial [Planctomycetota bacterium]